MQYPRKLPLLRLSRQCDSQAERLQQYQNRIAQESEAVLMRAETQRAQSNLELLVNTLEEEEKTRRDAQARCAADVIILNFSVRLHCHDASSVQASCVV